MGIVFWNNNLGIGSDSLPTQGALCTAFRKNNQQRPTTTNNDNQKANGSSCEVFFKISGDGAHLVSFFPEFPRMKLILWGFVRDFPGWGASYEVLSGIHGMGRILWGFVRIGSIVWDFYIGSPMYAINFYSISVVRQKSIYTLVYIYFSIYIL